MKGGGHSRPDSGFGVMLTWIPAGPGSQPSRPLAAQLWFWEQGTLGVSAGAAPIHSPTGTRASLVT